MPHVKQGHRRPCSGRRPSTSIAKSGISRSKMKILHMVQHEGTNVCRSRRRAQLQHCTFVSYHGMASAQRWGQRWAHAGMFVAPSWLCVDGPGRGLPATPPAFKYSPFLASQAAMFYGYKQTGYLVCEGYKCATMQLGYRPRVAQS